MNLTSGLSYFTFGENTDYSITNYRPYDSTKVITTDSIISVYFDSINNVVYFNYYQYDSIIHNVDTTKIKSSNKNRFSYITIPFLLGYNLNYKKLDINLRAGIGYSYLVSKKGRYINYLMTDFENAMPKKNLFNYIISPTINYSIHEKISIVINPQLVINSKNILVKTNVMQRYKNYGILIGISYHLKEKKQIDKNL